MEHIRGAAVLGVNCLALLFSTVKTEDMLRFAQIFSVVAAGMLALGQLYSVISRRMTVARIGKQILHATAKCPKAQMGDCPGLELLEKLEQEK
jgi:predicted metal-binding protein